MVKKDFWGYPVPKSEAKKQKKLPPVIKGKLKSPTKGKLSF